MYNFLIQKIFLKDEDLFREDIEKLSPEKLAELYDADKAVPTSGILSWLFGR